MSDLRTLMHQSVAPVPAVDAPTVDADLARGRQALHRRRARRLSAGSGLLVAAVLGTVAVVSNGLQPSLDRPAPPASTAQPRSGAAIDLVAYTGAQPSGYVLDKVPSGWTVRDDTAGVLTLAPSDAAAPDGDLEGAISFEGVIAITTEADTGLPTGVRLDDVEVAGTTRGRSPRPSRAPAIRAPCSCSSPPGTTSSSRSGTVSTGTTTTSPSSHRRCTSRTTPRSAWADPPHPPLAGGRPPASWAAPRGPRSPPSRTP